MKLWKITSMALLGGALGWGSTIAHATIAPPAPSVTVAGVTHGAAAPGGVATTSFTLSFTGPYEFIGVAMDLTYDPAALTFNPAQSSVSVFGTSYTLPTFLGLLEGIKTAPGSDFDYYGGQSSPGELFFGAGYLFTGSMPLEGDIVVTTAFNIAPSVLVGTQSHVLIHQLQIADVESGIVPLASSTTPITMTVSAVPEPESWLMMLAGVGLLGAVARRRTARA